MFVFQHLHEKRRIYLLKWDFWILKTCAFCKHCNHYTAPIFQEREIIAKPRSSLEDLLSWKSVQSCICFTPWRDTYNKASSSLSRAFSSKIYSWGNFSLFLDRWLQYFSAFLTKICSPPNLNPFRYKLNPLFALLLWKSDCLVYSILSHIWDSPECPVFTLSYYFFFFFPNFLSFRFGEESRYLEADKVPLKIRCPQLDAVFHCSHQWPVNQNNLFNLHLAHPRMESGLLKIALCYRLRLALWSMIIPGSSSAVVPQGLFSTL